MTFDGVLERVRELLQSKGRVAYRALKRRFELDDDYLEDLKAELIDAEHVALDEDGKVLVWKDSLASRVQSLESEEQRREMIGQTLDSRLSDSRLSAAERRQLTVMFCDLVGSTALSTQLDPEELREVVRAYQHTCTAVIKQLGGHVAQYLGDGLLVYFGYPVAHEDDAARAVRAGLEIITALQRTVPSPLAGEGQGEGAKMSAVDTSYPSLPWQGRKELLRLQVRIGIHTGPVVVGEMGSGGKREQLALGETPNLAARIQGQAAPDEVMISAATYHLVEGLFTCEDHGQPELKGISTPLTLYRVVKESEAHSRFEVVVRKGLTPLIGREHEFGMLCERWERVKDGAGQVVLLSGEPGIGKSRLVEALKEMVEREGARCLELRCSPYTQNSALQPVIEHLQRTLHFHPDDAAEEKLRKLIQALERRGETRWRPEQANAHVIASPSTALRINSAKQSLQGTEIAPSPTAPRNDMPHLQEVVPLLAALLSLPHPEGYPPLTFSPQKQKEKTHQALAAWLCAEAKQHAVTYAWEDLHWTDPSTLELLALFLQQAPTTRLLAVLTFRPEFVPPWGAYSYLSQLTLSRLGRNHVEAMVEKVTGGRALPKEIVQQIASKTDGVPLFVEELTKSVVESVEATRASPLPLGIPATLQDALMARLDRLGTAKEIAQLGATLGREFTYELLQAVSPLSEGILQQGLKQLVDSELVYQSGIPPHARYLFKHALVQDTAYQSLLKSRRQQLHQQIALVLEERFAEIKETQPELLAHHYTEASLIEQAIPYWQQAGERASQRSAYVEAVAHLTRGLEVLKASPDSPERLQHELALQTLLGSVFMITKDQAAQETGAAFRRAYELCQYLGDTPQLFPTLAGLRRFYTGRGELNTARELAQEMVTVAQRARDPALLVEAHHALGNGLFWQGEFVAAQAQVEQGIAIHNPQQHRSLAFVYGHDPGVQCWNFAARVLWMLGYPDQALQRSPEALTLARELAHPPSQAIALNFASILHQLRREEQLSQEWAEAVIALSTEHGFALFSAMGTVQRGWALTEQGQREEGIAQMYQGLTALQASGRELGLPYVLALLAEAYGKVGQVKEGLNALAEALALVNKNEERWYEAELYRLKGELLLAQAREQATGNGQQGRVIDP